MNGEYKALPGKGLITFIKTRLYDSHVNFWFKQITTLVPNLFIRVVFKFSDCLDLASYVLQLKMSSLTGREFNFDVS